MKKLSTTILLAAFALCAAAQKPRSQSQMMIDSLLISLARFDVVHPLQSQSTHGGRLTISTNVILDIPNKLDLVDTAKVKEIKSAAGKVAAAGADARKQVEALNERMRQRQRDGYAALDSVRRTLDRIARFATESYHYETHRQGYDTIQYSICIDAGTDTIVEKTVSNRANRVYFHNAKEAISFDSYSYPGSTYTFGNLQHTLQLRDTRNIDKTPFDVDGFERMVCKILKPMKRREIHWRHPETPLGKDTQEELFKDYRMTATSTTVNGTTNRGDTRGIVFTLPREREAEAKALLAQLNDSAFQYLDTRPSLFYSFYFRTRFSFNPTTLLNVYYHPDIADRDRALHYEIQTFADDHGYHIFLLRTDGTLWVPRELTTLKSFVDGKKVYLVSP